ncbi:MAG: hypothetical protein ACOCT0_05940, partial [Halobacteriota archaeon]
LYPDVVSSISSGLIVPWAAAGVLAFVGLSSAFAGALAWRSRRWYVCAAATLPLCVAVPPVGLLAFALVAFAEPGFDVDGSP